MAIVVLVLMVSQDEVGSVKCLWGGGGTEGAGRGGEGGTQ